MIDSISLILGLTIGLLIGGLLIIWLLWSGQKGRQTLQQQLADAKARLAQQNNTEQEEKMRLSFESIARSVLDQNAAQLHQSHQQGMQHLLDPLKERLQSFEQKVDDTYQKEARERFHLQKEIEQLLHMNQSMREEANNLTKALKGDSKVQGNWGELVLSRVLESSGLREGEEYVIQAKELSLTNEEGRRLQPDVIIQLPDQKHIIIDSKVSLTAYERYTATESREDRQTFARQHLQSVLTHIQQLSDKHYANLKGLQAPDFVLLFMPIEPAFSLALQERKDLFAYAWERKIVLVSPTTLLATLKTVASLWKLEQQNANAMEIARQGGALYDKFVGFAEELEKVGVQLERAQRSHAEAMNRLRSGHGNLLGRAEKLRKLGVKHKKQLPGQSSNGA
ncbi:MAG: DNA recombination protein RmuC [Bacteroidota bacterium]